MQIYVFFNFLKNLKFSKYSKMSQKFNRFALCITVSEINAIFWIFFKKKFKIKIGFQIFEILKLLKNVLRWTLTLHVIAKFSSVTLYLKPLLRYVQIYVYFNFFEKFEILIFLIFFRNVQKCFAVIIDELCDPKNSSVLKFKYNFKMATIRSVLTQFL